MNISESDLEKLLSKGNVRIAGAQNSPPVAVERDEAKGIPAGRADKTPCRANSGPNKTEAEYGRMLALEFPGAEIVYEGITFRMQNGHKYTPDYVVKSCNCILLVEVKARGKNGFRQASYGRAKLAYDQCRKEYPMFEWRWVEKSGGIWQ